MNSVMSVVNGGVSRSASKIDVPILHDSWPIAIANPLPSLSSLIASVPAGSTAVPPASSLPGTSSLFILSHVSFSPPT